MLLKPLFPLRRSSDNDRRQYSRRVERLAVRVYGNIVCKSHTCTFVYIKEIGSVRICIVYLYTNKYLNIWVDYFVSYSQLSVLYIITVYYLPIRLKRLF